MDLTADDRARKNEATGEGETGADHAKKAHKDGAAATFATALEEAEAEEGAKGFPSAAKIPTGKAVVAAAEPGLFKFTAALEAPSVDDYEAARNRAWDTEGFCKTETNWVTDKRGYRWRLVYFPYGNNSKGFCSVYLAIDERNPEHPPPDAYCRRWVKFSIRARRAPRSPAKLALQTEEERKAGNCEERFEFTKSTEDWGFPCFLAEEDMRKEPSFLTADGRLVVDVTIEELPGFQKEAHYNSRKETGMVGLRNQGATCYMNSLLQFLWSVRSLRRAVYAMPTEGEDADKSVALALQRVFFRLQMEPRAVGTKELTKAFGWNSQDSFIQHDVQELARVLCDRLEDKMKGTGVEGTVKALFGGLTRPTTRCVNVNYQSSREEEFYDVQLTVTGCATLKDSLEAFVKTEFLTGADQYEADGHGKQDAQRFTVFTQYPPVMTIHLKRFEYNLHTGNMIKVNQRFEFPTTLDLEPYLAEELRGAPLPYRLHSVLVHSGDVNTGHYYAYIRQDDEVGPAPERASWFKYDDEVVTKVSEAEMLEDSFGTAPVEVTGKRVPGGMAGAMRNLISKATSSAYMLVYVREDAWPTVMRPLANADVPAALVERFREEKATTERKAREARESYLYTSVELLQEEDVRRLRQYGTATDFVYTRKERTGNMIMSSLKTVGSGAAGEDEKEGEGGARAPLIKVKKTEPVAAIMLQVREKLGIPLHRQRLWAIVARRNTTKRLDDLLTMPIAEEVRATYEEAKTNSPHRSITALPVETPPTTLLSPVSAFNRSITPIYVEDIGEQGGDDAGVGVKAEMEEASVKVEAEEEVHTDDGDRKKKRVAIKAEADTGTPLKRPKTEEGAGAPVASRRPGAAAAGTCVHTVDELVEYLKVYPPVPPPPDSAFIFFKAYRPQTSCADGPLTYLLSLHLPRRLTVREVLARVRAHVDWLPAEDDGVEVYEEVTLKKVQPLKPDETLEHGEINTGDVLVLQLADPVYPPFQPVVQPEMEYYNVGPPRHAPDYFRYLMYRRVFHMRPYGPLEESLLQRCAADLVAAEVPGKMAVVRQRGGAVEEIVVEVDATWSYQQYQRLLGHFLRAAGLEAESGCLRFHPVDGYHDGPAKMKRGLPKLQDLQNPNTHIDGHWGPTAFFFASRDHHAHREETLYFEVMPFTLQEMAQEEVRDVVIHDARLRRMAARCLQEHQRQAQQEGVESGEDVGAVMDVSAPATSTTCAAASGTQGHWCCKAPCHSLKGVWTEFLAPQVQELGGGKATAETGEKEPLVLSLLVPKEGMVDDLLEAVKEALGKEAEGLELMLLDVSSGKVNSVLQADRAVGGLVESSITTCVDGPTASTRKLVLHMPDQPSTVFEELSLQVNFLNMGADHPRPVPGGPPVTLPIVTYPVGLPLLISVQAGDSLEEVLPRVAAKVGRPVEDLGQWAPTLEVDNKVYAVQPSQVGVERKPLADYVAGKRLEGGFHRLGQGGGGLEKMPALTFLAAEAVGVSPKGAGGKRENGNQSNRRGGRRMEMGIKIRND